MDNAAFRAAFPEFSDKSVYPDEMLTLWGDFATSQVNECRWKSQTLMGIRLYVAHEITLAARNLKVSSNGGTPGDSSGPVNTKTVGPATISYDTQQAAEKDAGHWNMTSYGKQFLRLSRIFGAGVIQI